MIDEIGPMSYRNSFQLKFACTPETAAVVLYISQMAASLICSLDSPKWFTKKGFFYSCLNKKCC